MKERTGHWIRQRRRDLGMKRREDLAARTGLGLSTVLRAETGKEVNRATMISIAKALGLEEPEVLADWATGVISQEQFMKRLRDEKAKYGLDVKREGVSVLSSSDPLPSSSVTLQVPLSINDLSFLATLYPGREVIRWAEKTLAREVAKIRASRS